MTRWEKWGAYARTRRHQALTIAGTTLLGALVVGSVAAATSVGSHALAAGDIYSMSIAGLAGPGSTGGPGDISVASWSFGTSRAVTLSADGRQIRPGHSKPGTIVITRSVDKASPVLLSTLTSQRVYPTLTLYATSPGATGAAGTTMTVVFSNVVVAADTISGAPVSVPKETVTLNYTKVEWH